MMTARVQATAQRPATAGLPISIYGISGVLALTAMLTTNALLTSASVLTLLLLVRLLWRPGEPPALLFAAGFQWLQVSTLVFVADYQRMVVSSLSFSAHVETAIWLSLAGVAALAIGMRLSAGRSRLVSASVLQGQVEALSVERVFGAYLLSALVVLPFPSLAARMLPLAQPLYALASIKWIFYVVLGVVTMRRKTKISYFLIACAIELLTGIGFFAEFKTLLLVAGLVVLSSHIRFTGRTLILISLTGALAFLFGLAWMSVREQYRNYLNQGTRQQVVLVSPVERVTTLADLVSDIDAEQLGESVQLTLRRLAYVEYFGAVIDYVPSKRGYENGGMLWRAISHIFIPRFIDPDKPILESDSEITMRYTGLSVASSDEGTSIGLGYMAEMYVDFGPYGMIICVFLFGLMWGAMYAYLSSARHIPPYGEAAAAVLLLSATQFEIAEIKLLGGMVARFLILALLLRYALPSVHRLLVRRGTRLPQPDTRGDTPVLA